MAQPKLDIVDIALSSPIGDTITTSGAAGEIFSAADRLSAINRATGFVYKEIYDGLGEKDFCDKYPEFVSVATKSLTKDADIQKVINLYADSKVIKPIPNDRILDAQYNTASPFYASASNPGFVESDTTVTVYGITLGGGSVTMLYIKKPTFIAGYGGANADLIIPYAWLQHIIEKATQILLLEQNEQ